MLRVIEDEQYQTVKMSEVWKTVGLCDRACKGSDVLTTAAPRREVGCYLHGLCPEEEIVNESNWLENNG
jgi:hypothetical protein